MSKENDYLESIYQKSINQIGLKNKNEFKTF